MVRAIQGDISSRTILPTAAAPASKEPRLPALQSEAPSGRSLAGRAFEQLSGSAFDKVASPSMEYLIYEIFREAARAKPDEKIVHFLLDSLEDDAPQNLQPVLAKCLELIPAGSVLSASLAKRLESLPASAYRSSEELGLSEEPQEIAWSRLGMLAAAALTGLLVLSALFGPRPAPPQQAEQAPCFPTDEPRNQTQPLVLEEPIGPCEQPLLANESQPPLPAPKSSTDRFVEEVGLPAGVTRAQLDQAVAAAEARHNLQKFIEQNRHLFGPPLEETPPAAPTTDTPPAEEARPLVFANQTQSSIEPFREETPLPAAVQRAQTPAPQSSIDRLIEGVGLPPGATRPQLEQAVAAADARENLRKFFERNQEMFTPLEKETAPDPEPAPNPPAEHAEPSSLLIPAAVAIGIGIIHLW